MDTQSLDINDKEKINQQKKRKKNYLYQFMRR